MERWVYGMAAGALLAGIVIAAPARAEDAASEKQPDAASGKPKKEKKEKKPVPPEPLRDYKLGLEYFPVGRVVPKNKLRFTGYIPLRPVGFRANEYGAYLAPTYGLGDGWEITAGATGAERLGRGGEALFYGLGIQKQLHEEGRGWPAISVGSFGMTGPHDHHSGSFYAVGSKKLWGANNGRNGLYLHGGLRYELFSSRDYGDSSGVRPFAGLSLGVSKRLFFSGEVSPAQAWEIADVYSLRTTYLLYKSIGVSGGIRGDGYRTYPFVEAVF